MKKFLSLFAFVAIVSSFAACTRSASDNATLTTAAATGNWKVGLLTDNSSDHTTNFTGWVFSISSNGVITATNGSISVPGTWSVKESEFRIDFGANAALEKISKHWVIIDQSNTTIKLKDDSPSSIEELHLVKI